MLHVVSLDINIAVKEGIVLSIFVAVKQCLLY